MTLNAGTPNAIFRGHIDRGHLPTPMELFLLNSQTDEKCILEFDDSDSEDEYDDDEYSDFGDVLSCFEEDAEFENQHTRSRSDGGDEGEEEIVNKLKTIHISSPPSILAWIPEPPPRPVTPRPGEHDFPLAHLVYTYHHNPPSLRAVEASILHYLHSNPLTPADVDLLLPAFERVYNVTNKLATNIGLSYSRGQISGADLARILECVFRKGDRNYILFERTKERIARFTGEKMDRERQAEWRSVENHNRNELDRVARFMRKGFYQVPNLLQYPPDPDLELCILDPNIHYKGRYSFLETHPVLTSDFFTINEEKVKPVVNIRGYVPKNWDSKLEQVRSEKEDGKWRQTNLVAHHLFQKRKRARTVVRLPNG